MKLLKDSQMTDDPEILHRVRVEIKKIKAFLRLLHFSNKKFDDHHEFLPFRRIFRACGELREPHMFYSLIVKLKGKPLNHPTDYEESFLRFRKNIPKYARSITKQEKQILKETRTLTAHTYRKYLKKKKKEMKEGLYPKFIRSELHSTRKVVKEILYLSTIACRKKEIDSFYRDSATLIGEWHDAMTFIRSQQKKRPADAKLIKKLRQESNANLKLLRGRIRRFYGVSNAKQP